ncbi:HdeD family acid-resistance protein [Nostoc sp.]|uniref:HdeD family acid-resistance protein n=1 Tax=Nostoc sp. TaxID=1180 RepID=UPI002FF6BFAA
MRTIEPETNEQVVSSGWTTAIPLVAVGIAILMIVLGIIAIAFPFFASVASTLLFGWIFIFAGITQIVYAFQSRGAGKVIWKLILGLLYFLAGILVVANPFAGVLALTLVLGITIFVQGIIQVSIAFQMRRISPNWGLMLVSGIIGIIFGIFLWSNFPFGAVWLIGTFIGINLLFDGIWMLTLHSGQGRTSQ